MANVAVLYSAIVTHDMAGAVTVEGRMIAPAPVTDEQVREVMIDGLVNGDVPPEWGWTREKIDVVRFHWTDLEVPEEEN
jgi:hypothetical protein